MEKNFNFPKDQHGRAFLKPWFLLFNWLGYDKAKDRSYCIYCLKHSTNTKVTVFTKTGFNDWTHAMNAYKKHELSSSHEASKQIWLIKSRGDEPVSIQIHKGHKKEVLENRVNLTKLIEVLLLTANQCIALRGHDESSTSQNKGNFKEVLNLLAKHNPSLCAFLNKSINYTSPAIQNELLSIAATQIRNKITSAVILAEFYATIFDGTTDLSTTEQLSFCVRYVDNKFIVHER